MSKLFIRLLKLAGSEEDALTECLAAVLAEDPEFARDFVQRLCGETVGGPDLGAREGSGSGQPRVPATRRWT